MKKQSQKAEAFLDFVRKNGNGLRGVKAETAAHVIEILADEGMEVRKLLIRVIDSFSSNLLFGTLYGKVCNDEAKRVELLDAIITIPRRVWLEGNLSHHTIRTAFSRAEDFEHLLKCHRAVILQPDDEHWERCFSSDEYWRKRVRWYIAKGDHCRAWDELRKAWRGFFVGAEEGIHRFGTHDPAQHVFQASKEVLTECVRELFQVMNRSGEIPALTDDDCVLKYEYQWRNGWSLAAGYDFACLYRTQKGRIGHGDSRTVPHIFCVEGAMVLKIAKHFREEQNARRRKRWNEASAT
jgi:hypothetical protein